MLRLALVFLLCCFCVGAAQASGSVVAWTSDTSYIVFDGTAQANIIGSGTVASGSNQIALGKPQVEMSALVTGKAISTGVAATDPSIGKTITAISSALAADAAAGSVCSGGGIWGYIGCAALSAITQAAVFLGVDKLWSWLFGSNQVSYTPSASTTVSSGFIWEGSVWVPANSPLNSQSYPTAVEECSTDPNAIAQAILGGLNNVYGPRVNSSYTYSQETLTENNASSYASGSATYTDIVLGGSSSSYQNTFTIAEINSSSCSSANTLAPITAQSPVSTSVSGAVSALPSSELSGAADPDTTADMINAVWYQASQQSGYAGVPYPSTNPIQSSDVTTWEGNNSGFAPTLGDDLGVGSGVGSQGNGASSSTAGYVPQSGLASDGTGPSSSTSGGTTSGGATSGTSGSSSDTSTSGASGTTSATSDTADLCADDPSASACASLGTVTAGSLPASSVSVSLSPWAIGPSSGACPPPQTVQVFGSTLSFDYSPLCSFATQVSPLFVALCAIAAAFIIVMGIRG